MTIRILITLLLTGLLVLIPSLAEAEEPGLTDADPIWFSCEKAADCTVVQGFCYQPESANRQYAEAYESWVKLSPPVHCALMPPVSKICITCEENRCRARTERAPTELESLIDRLSAPPPEAKPEY